ncbi:hypothetical protein LXL04_019409 [Taraxacum kok-saghyz]
MLINESKLEFYLQFLIIFLSAVGHHRNDLQTFLTVDTKISLKSKAQRRNQSNLHRWSSRYASLVQGMPTEGMKVEQQIGEGSCKARKDERSSDGDAVRSEGGRTATRSDVAEPPARTVEADPMEKGSCKARRWMWSKVVVDGEADRR